MSISIFNWFQALMVCAYVVTENQSQRKHTPFSFSFFFPPFFEKKKMVCLCCDWFSVKYKPMQACML